MLEQNDIAVIDSVISTKTMMEYKKFQTQFRNLVCPCTYHSTDMLLVLDLLPNGFYLLKDKNLHLTIAQESELRKITNG